MPEAAYLQSTRADYDSLASAYAERFPAGLENRSLERGITTAFAELVTAAAGGPVADLGCGPGHITADLDALGLSAFGVDLSPAMIALARQSHPQLQFHEGSMTALNLPDGALGGIVSRFSIIHTPPGQMPTMLAEFSRVLAVGGQLLLSFAVADDPEQVQDLDHTVTRAFRWSPVKMTDLLRAVGLTVHARLICGPDADSRFGQAYLIAQKLEPIVS